MTVYAAESNDTASFGIPSRDIINSEIFINENEASSSIELSIIKEIGSDGTYTNYEKTQYTIISDDTEELFNIYARLLATKTSYSTRASGNENDFAWFYGSSLCISSTIYYNTFYSSGLEYGKIDHVDVYCSSNSGTVIDSIYIYYGENGYAYLGGYVQYHDAQYINNNSPTYFPSTWPYILWDGSQGSDTGASVTATVHRNSSDPRQYTFTHNIIGALS